MDNPRNYVPGPRKGAAVPRQGVAGPVGGAKVPHFRPVPNPIENIPKKDTVEEAALAEISAVASGYKAEEERQRSRVLRNDDANYIAVLVFESQDQKNEFLKKAGLFDHGDYFLDGRYVAAKFGINVTHTDWRPQKVAADKKLSEIASDS